MADPCEDAQTASDAFLEAATGPKRVTVDGMTTEMHGLREQIELDRYLKAKCAAKRRTHGIRLTRLIPGGTE